MINGLLSWFESLVPPFPEKDKGMPPSNLAGFIWFYSKGLWKFLLTVSLLNSLIALGEALFFASLGLIVDWTASSSPVSFLSLHGRQLLIMLICAGVILPAASIFHSLLLHQTLSSNYSMQVRWQLHRYLLGQSLSFFSDEFAGRVANKVMQTSMALRIAVLKLMDVLVHLAVYICAMLIMLQDASPLLCLPLAVWLVIYTASLFCFIPRLRKASQRQSDLRSEMVGRIVDSYANIATVKLFGSKGREEKYAEKAMDGFIRSEYTSLRILTLFDISVQLMNYTLLITLVMTSLWLWSNYVITTGSIAVAAAIAIRMINLSRWVMWEAGAIFENIGMVYDGIGTMSKPVSVQDKPKARQGFGFDTEIVFKHVSFSYVEGKPVFKDLDLRIKKGEKIGVVGSSGVGKSTFVNLLLRFYDVNSGSICLDGIDIRDLKQEEYRDLFSMVSQDPGLMHRTVGENILYGSDVADKDDLIRVARATDSLSFISNLSDYQGGFGFDTMIGDRGVKLSGGQRQRIALSRVLLKNAPILILDEATSALDSESERIIQQNLAEVMRGRTVIAIAHRLSTLTEMDRILVIDEGKIVQSGSHEELLKENGIYKKLWSIQSGGFIG